MTSTPPNEPNQPNQPKQPTEPGGFPVHPGTPPQQAGPGGPAQVAQPPSIRLAVRLMWLGAVLSLVGLVVTLLTLDSLKTQLRDSLDESDPGYTQSTFDALYAVTIGIAVAVSLIGAGIWLWMAWKNGQGRSWARIVATVLGGFSVLSTLYTVAAGAATGASIVVTVLGLLVAVAILVLLWRKESSAFYAAHSRPQPG